MITKMIIMYLLLVGEVTTHGEDNAKTFFAFIDKHENYVDHIYAEELVTYYLTGVLEFND